MDQKGHEISDLERDSDKLSALFAELFGILPVIGAAFGDFRNTKWSIISYCVYTLSYTSAILSILDILYTSYLVRNNMSMFSASFHIFLVGCVVLTASLALTLQRKGVIALALGFLYNPNVSEYQSSSTYFKVVEKNTVLKMQRLMLMFLLAYGTCGVVALFAPFIDMYLGNDEAVTNVSGIYWKKLPAAMWWPFDAHNSTIAYLSCLMCLGVFASFAPLMCTSAILICFFACEKIINHKKLLIHSINHLDKRAQAMFKDCHPEKSLSGSETEFDLCYYECIIQNVKHHHEILKAKDGVARIANYAIAVPFFGGAMLLGLAMLNLLSNDDPRIGPKLLLVGLGMTEAANMLLLCMYGEAFQQISGELFDSVFYTKWYLRSVKCRRALVILRLGSIKPMKLSAAQLIELNMDTFGNLVNSAYSIFNLSAASK